eukprot:Opistho-2@83502
MSNADITRRKYRARFVIGLATVLLVGGFFFMRSTPFTAAINADGNVVYREAPTGADDGPGVGRLDNTDPPGAPPGDKAENAQGRGDVPPVEKELVRLRSPGRYQFKPIRPSQDRRRAVRDAFLHAWRGYRQYAWGHDEIQPRTNGTNDSWGHFAVTMIDSLDTLIIMGLSSELEEAQELLATIRFCESDAPMSFFETTIRHLGGLLSAYELSREHFYLEKAIELADCLLPAFNTKTGIPYHTIVLKTGVGKNPTWSGGSSLLAEAGSVQLEFKYLSAVSGNQKYARAAERALDAIAGASRRIPGLYPLYISPESGSFTNDHVSFGAMGDSFYEYLLKQQLLFPSSEGGRAGKYRRMYDEAVAAMEEHLVGRSHPRGLTFIGEMKGSGQYNLMDHLACYVPGMLALGAQPFAVEFISPNAAKDKMDKQMTLAKDIAETCATLYADQPSGLGPESVRFNEKDSNSGDYKIEQRKYMLRPEAIESMFILYRVTGDEKYREQAWAVFKAIERHCRTASAFSGVSDVTASKPEHDNSMQSFFMAETLKYLYLIFGSNDDLPLNEYVFTTEAHPLGVIGMH